MRFLNFSSRNRKEILRDPLSLVFGIGFPVIMLALFSVLSNSIQGMPKEIFSISNFAPDMVVFGLSFITLFLGTLMANDRKSSFLARLFSSPLKERLCLGIPVPNGNNGYFAGYCMLYCIINFRLRIYTKDFPCTCCYYSSKSFVHFIRSVTWNFLFT